MISNRMAPALMVAAGCLAAGVPASIGAAQENREAIPASPDMARSRPMPLARLQGPITLDGRVNEAAWDAIDPLPMSLFSPRYLGPLTERSEIRVGYDDRYLYLSGRLYDSDPKGIRTNTFYRDVYSGDDLLAIVLDSYNDHETAVWFTTNPAGARTDRTMANDAVTTTTFPMNADWNSHWNVATTQDSLGWYAEFRIPFSTLRFQASDDRVTMGMIVYRFVARKNERQTFPAVDPKWGGFAFAKPSQAQRVSLSGVRQTKPVYLTPYALGGFRRVATLGRAEAGGLYWDAPTDGTGELGADLRYSPTSNLALDLTVNTDFAQVEADDQQINLTRFPLFFPEKRQFFQERASTFQFNWRGSTDRLFHSRRIGLVDGEPIRIYGGIRAVGRIGGMDYGVLSMQTASAGPVAGENVSVVRLNQQVFNPYSSIGGMVTSRLGGSRDNVAYGADAVIRPFGDEWITLKWAQTFDDSVSERSTLEAGSILARWERIDDDGLSYSAEYGRVGGDYLPGLGFQSRREFRFLGGSVQYKRYQAARSSLRSLGGVLRTSHYHRTSDGRPETRSVEASMEIETREGHEISIGSRSSFESVTTGFPVAGAVVPAGDYWFHEGFARVELPRSDRFRGNFSATAGQFYDGHRVGVSASPSWNPSKYLEVGGGYEINRIVFPDRGGATTAHLARLKLQVALNTKVSFNTFLQYSNVADLATFNARFRYHLREGNDLWMVYNEGLNTVREVGSVPRLPLSSGRTLLVKYTHTAIW
ncbi:MAG: carbohydrate binding family 9 domain-containing protein [Gemmatimonadetes bacterium]|nr:carbohydrate binding family 9 domain-containing protein [Gemmatimonadota bacterium]